jgi:integrase
MAHVEDRWYRKGPDGRKVKTARYGTGKRWRARITGPDGKEHGKCFDLKTEAERFMNTSAADVTRGTWLAPDAGRVTLQTYGEGWLSMQTFEASTREAVETRLRKHVYPVLGRYTLAQLAASPSLVQAWLAGLAVSDAYAKVIFTTLSTILNAAVADKKITANPCRERNVVKRRKAASRPVEAWASQQVADVRAALPERWRILVDLGADLGLRQGEIFGLAVGDVDFLRKVVHVRRQVRIVGSRLVFAPPKGGESKIRDVPLPKTIALALAQHLERHPARKVILPWEQSGGEDVTAELVLTSVTGKACNRNTFNTYVWKPALEAAEIPATRANGVHVLRHTFASNLLHHGVGIKAVSDYLGHSSAAITLGIYAHTMPAHDQMRAVIDQVAADRGPGGQPRRDAQMPTAAGPAHPISHGPATAQAGA